MSDKFYVGRDLTGFENNGKTRPISRVTLIIDENTSVTAGDDSGLEISRECPYATQEMADAILAKLKGYQYQMYTADAANIDPAAELGDGITADGVYGVISRLSDDGGGYPDVTGPGEAELEDEYPVGEGPMTKEINRKLGATRSLITKTAEEIRLEITREVDGLSTSFDVKLGEIRGEITDAVNGVSTTFDAKIGSITTQITGLEGRTTTLEQTDESFRTEVSGLSGRVSTVEQTASGLTTSVQGLNGRVTTVEQTASGLSTSVQGLSGRMTTVEQTAEGLSSSVEGLNGRMTTAEQTADGFSRSIQGLDGRFTKIEETVNGVTYTGPDGKVWINNGNINLTGHISWEDLDADVHQTIWNQSTDLPDYIQNTYIDEVEIRSPTIKGGVIQGGILANLNSDGTYDAWLEAYSRDPFGGGFRFKTTSYEYAPIFQIAAGDFYNVSMSFKGATILKTLEESDRQGNRIVMPQETWDFSEANVTGLTFA